MLVKMVKELRKRDDDKVFAEPVDATKAVGYRTVVHHPMDLGTMAEKAAGGVYVDEVPLIADFHLMCNNALRYNPPCVSRRC